ncbi:MAG TPA: methyltransferase, partial [Aggregatilineales bacterium]|nr:methyltransferase [Aggregatilineales bacterium]
MHPDSFLFDKYAYIQPGTHLLSVNLEDDRLLRGFAEQAESLTVLHRERGILRDLQKHFQRDTHITVSDAVFPESGSKFDAALVSIPKGRSLARAFLVRTLQALNPGGIMFAAGANNGGAKTAFTDMNVIAQANTLGTKARHRIFAVVCGDEMLSIPEDWGTPWEPYQMTITVHERDYVLYTQPGIFSYEHLDLGTEFLLDNLDALDLPEHPRILDAGCGYGIVGMVAQQELNPGKVVWADSDLLAVRCTQKT